MTDPELVTVWREWWDALPYVIEVNPVPAGVEDEDAWMAAADLASLESALAEHGFAIVRRMDADLPG